jgi:hypothetical protein
MWRITKPDIGDGLEEEIFVIRGILCEKALPPIDEKPK